MKDYKENLITMLTKKYAMIKVIINFDINLQKINNIKSK